MRSILSVVSFCVALFAVNRVVVDRVPLAPEAGLRSKAEYAIEHASEFDAIFIGSSATLYGIRPDVFADRLEELGFPGIKTFNLGVGGMGSFETVAILERFLDAGPKKLRWVFYEEPLFDPLLWYPNIVNQRYLHWHTASLTTAAVKALSFAENPPSYKREQYEGRWYAGGSWKRAAALEHIELGLRHEFAVGQGSRIVSAALGKAELWPTVAEIEAGNGWMDITKDPEPGARRANADFLAHPDDWKKRVATMRAQEDRRPEFRGRYDVHSLRRLMARIRGEGAEPIVYVAPRGLPSAVVMSLADAGEIPTLFPFHVSSQYPDLVDPTLRFDESHLSPEGAAVWTKHFADRFAEHLRSTKQGER